MDFRACHVFSVSADCTSSAIAATWLVPTFYPGSSPWSRLPHLTTWATLICLPWTMKNLWILPSISTPVAEQLSWGFSLMIPSIQINHIIISYHITSYHNVCKTVVPIIYIYIYMYAEHLYLPSINKKNSDINWQWQPLLPSWFTPGWWSPTQNWETWSRTAGCHHHPRICWNLNQSMVSFGLIVDTIIYIYMYMRILQ